MPMPGIYRSDISARRVTTARVANNHKAIPQDAVIALKPSSLTTRSKSLSLPLENKDGEQPRAVRCNRVHGGRART